MIKVIFKNLVIMKEWELEMECSQEDTTLFGIVFAMLCLSKQIKRDVMPGKGEIYGLEVMYSGHISIRMRPYVTVYCAQESSPLRR